MNQVVNCLKLVAGLAKKKGYPVQWETEGNVSFNRNELSYARKLGVNPEEKMSPQKLVVVK